MNFLKFLSNKNSDFLKDDELEAAQLLQSIVTGNINKTPIPDGIAKLTIGIYLISFNRTNKEIVPLQVLKSSAALAKNPKLSKYLVLLKVIRTSIEKFTENKKVQIDYKNNKLFEEFMLMTIKASVKEINQI
ncbi:MAG: hypothetical protein JKY48_00820 [Flavobacteriales bacterium]|nr:hypothetical protein [Flavobacteriales bacterium]